MSVETIGRRVAHQPVATSDIELHSAGMSDGVRGQVAPTARPRSGRMERMGEVFSAANEQLREVASEAKGDCCFTCLNCFSLEERAKHKRKLIFHRTSPLSFWFALLVLIVGAMVGLFVKRIKANGTSLSNIKNTVADSVNDAEGFNEKTINYNDFLYWMTYFCWSGRWYVQAMLNFTRGRTLGLSVNYVMWSLLASTCHLLSVLVAQFNGRTIASFDNREAEVDVKIQIYAYNGVISIALVLLQCWRYDGWNNQKPSALVRGTFILALVFTIFYMVINMAMLKDSDSSSMAIDRWVYATEILSIICSVVCFVPQFNLHRFYKVVIGVDICHLVLQLLGALSLFCLIFISILRENNFEFSNFATFREVINVEIRQIVQSVLIIFAVATLFAQFCFYWQLPTLSDVEKKANVPSRNAPIQHHIYTERERRASIGADPRSRSAMENATQDQRIARGHPSTVVRVGGPRPTVPVPRESTGDASGNAEAERIARAHAPAGGHVGADPRSRTQGQGQQHTLRPGASGANGRPVSLIRRAPISAPESQEEIEAARLVAQSAAALPGWNCPVCTYANAGVQLYCLLCETPFEDVVDQIQASPRTPV